MHNGGRFGAFCMENWNMSRSGHLQTFKKQLPPFRRESWNTKCCICHQRKTPTSLRIPFPHCYAPSSTTQPCYCMMPLSSQLSSGFILCITDVCMRCLDARRCKVLNWSIKGSQWARTATSQNSYILCGWNNCSFRSFLRDAACVPCRSRAMPFSQRSKWKSELSKPNYKNI